MEAQGKIILALPRRSGESARGSWEVQEFVLETNDNFTRKMVVSVFGSDRLQRFNIQEGQDVLVSFDIDAREYQGRWYNSIRAFDVRPYDHANAATMQAAAPFPPAPGMASPQPSDASVQSAMPEQSGVGQPASEGETADDLPF